MFCCRKHEDCVEVNGKFYHESHSKCHVCQTKLDHSTLFVLDNSIVYCRDCLQKRKDQQKRQNRLESAKVLEDNRKFAMECVVCRNPICSGEVCVKLTFENNFELWTGKLCLILPYYAYY